MVDISLIFDAMPERYLSDVLTAPRTYYFSVGEHRYTVRMTPARCEVTAGRSTEPADVVLKATPDLFLKMVVQGKNPSPLDIARGKIRTNDPVGLADLRKLFDFTPP